MASYYLAPALKALRAEVDRRWPYRDRASDGWIGDTSHSARKSDHNPDWGSGGVVRALDIDKDGIDTGLVLSALVKDFRVNYIIWNGRIYQRIHGFASRPYSGSNAHTQHMHISIRHGFVFENDTSPWLKKGQGGLPPGSGFQAGSPLDGVRLPGLDAIAVKPIIKPHTPAEEDEHMFRILVAPSTNGQKNADGGKVYLCRFGPAGQATFTHIGPSENEALERGGVELRKIQGRDYSQHERDLMHQAIVSLSKKWKA